ncbi:MAG: maleylpyruvate isomerase N-terminal domain-containing protein [Actinomycetota bacterium]
MGYEWIHDALATTWDDTLSLLRSVSPTDFDRPTPCPGWTVRDVVSHLSGFELMILGSPVPEMTLEYPTFVKNAVGRINQAYVEERRTWPIDAVIGEFAHVTQRSLARLSALSDEEWLAVGWSPEGDAAHWRFMETRVFDSWIHLQDIRDAVLQPHDDHGAGEEIVLNRYEGALGYIWGRGAAAPEGASLRLNISGRSARSVSLTVREGRATPVTVLEETPSVEISTPSALFWRRCAGRISAGAFLAASATDVRGDKDLAIRCAEAMAITI